MKALVYDVRPLGWITCKWLKRFHPACVHSPLGGLSLRELPPPTPAPGWVRVRTLLGGVCGTDLAIIAQKQLPNSILQAYSSMPMVMGHENVAVVEELGAGVEASWLARRVNVEPTLSCGPRGIEPLCPRCLAGEFGACQSFGENGAGASKLPPGTSIGYNAATGGAFGESFLAHASQLIAVPPQISDEQAVLVDPLACSLHAALRANLSEARRVLVYGAGVLGLGLVAAMRAIDCSAEIHALDRSAYCEPLAMGLGADRFVRLPAAARQRYEAVAALTGASVKRARFGNYTLSGGYDVVFDCVGSPASLTESLRWTRSRGQVVLVGTGHGGGVDLTPIWFTELTVTGAYGRQMEHYAGRRVGTYQLVHELLVAGKLRTDGLLTHRFPVGQYRQAMEVALNKGRHRAVKVAFDFRPRK